MHTPTLATRFANSARVLRSDQPLAEDQMQRAAPSIFAAGKHVSRSARYTHIPTIEVLRGLRREGFQPFMVAQGVSRIEGKTEYTKHMVRLRHAGEVRARPEAREIILINSHDGASSYQLMGGLFRYICHNGLVVGDAVDDIRIAHKGNVQGEVIEGAVRVLSAFDAVDACTDGMKALTLDRGEQHALATAALALRYGERDDGQPAPPITADQLNQPRRAEDDGPTLWQALQRLQENTERGGLPGRSASGRRVYTRAVRSIDRSVSLNRALWVLAEEMRRLKA